MNDYQLLMNILDGSVFDKHLNDYGNYTLRGMLVNEIVAYLYTKHKLVMRNGNLTNPLYGEIAGILVRLENGRIDDAREMCELLVGDTHWHEQAFAEFKEEFPEYSEEE